MSATPQPQNTWKPLRSPWKTARLSVTRPTPSPKSPAGAAWGAQQVRGLNERFLELMREAAFADQILTVEELTQLKRAADVPTAPDYFDDLQPTVADTNAPAGREPVSPTEASKPRKSGHCRTPGHYRSKCPELN